MKKQTITQLLLAGLLIFCTSCGSETTNENKKNEPMGTRPVYDFMQQVFCHTVLSNVSSQYNGNDSVLLQDSTIYAINAVINDPKVQNFMGRWKCVWGPVVYSNSTKNKGYKAMNTMYIANNLDSPNVFVVTIAGTDPTSYMDWWAEDFNVGIMSKWPYNNPTDSIKISMATFTGLSVLQLTLKDVARQNITADTFLRRQARSITGNGKMSIYVTGHSLGGALSPTYALYLNDIKDNAWGNPSNIIINCLAVAGPTPGNDSFSNYYNRKLGLNTTRVWNTKDQVPHGYDTTMISQADTLYTTDTISAPIGTKSAIWAVKKLVAGKRYTQIFPGNKGFISKYYNDAGRLAGNTHDTHTFPTQAGCMHVPAYANYFGIDSFQAHMQQILTLPYPFFSFGYAPAGIADSGKYLIQGQ